MIRRLFPRQFGLLMRLRKTQDRTRRMTCQPKKSDRWMNAGRSRVLILLALVLIALPAITAFSSESRAESVPWFDEFLIRFPEALLLEQESTPLLPPSDPQPPSQGAGRGIARASSSQFEVVSQALPPAQSVGPPTQAPPSLSPSTGRPYVFSESCPNCENVYWQLLPDGILYPSYVAGEKEPRMGTAVLHEKDRGPILESVIGGRLGLLRYGTPGPINPQGWQWDLESAAMLRQDFDEELDVEATDFRIGSVITWRRGATAVKGGIYHLSSHVGDEFLERNPTFVRRNFSRDALLIGVYHWLTDELSVYGEVAYGVRTDGGSEPFEFQFGAEYSSPAATDPHGAPFAAINVHGREEFDLGGGVNILAGWEWRGPTSNRRFRIGGQFYSGKELQYSFFDEDVTLVGAGIWYDF